MDAFKELKEELNKLQRGLQDAAAREPEIPAGTPLDDVPLRLKTIIAAQRNLMVAFLNDQGSKVPDQWVTEIVKVFNLAQYGQRVENRH